MLSKKIDYWLLEEIPKRLAHARAMLRELGYDAAGGLGS